MQKLRIGILGTRGVPNHYGGFEQFAEHLSVALVQRGHEVFVYNSSLHPFQKNEWNGVQIICCKDLENKFGTAGQFVYDWNCINDARARNFDVLLHLGYTSDSVWYWRWPRQSVNIVNMDGMEWQRTKYSRPVKYFLKWAESLAAKNAGKMIADSPGMQEYLFSKYRKEPVFIPYGARAFENPDPMVLSKYLLLPHQYFLVIARMEPENNIEMIIRGYLVSHHHFPLLLIGNISNSYGQYLTNKYRQPGVQFHEAIYNQEELDNLRFFSAMYFHGHSVGGTNPSLLEAMACRCRIAAHNNRFNRAVLQQEADYFPTAEEITRIISSPKPAHIVDQWKQTNITKIKTIYDPDRITDAYESLMLQCCGKKELVMLPSTAAAV